LKWISLFALLCLSVANSSTSEFEPVYAADQPRIGFESLLYERAQFDQFSSYTDVLGRAQRKTLERDQLRNRFRRATESAKKGAISEAELKRTEYLYRISEFQLLETQDQLDETRHSADLYRSYVLQNGNDGSDRRLEIATTMKLQLKSRKAAMVSNLNGLILQKDYFEKRFADGEYLHRQKAISDVELEARKFELDSTKISIETTRRRIEIMELAILGLDRSIDRLYN
jgi:hypothetical protein